MSGTISIVQNALGQTVSGASSSVSSLTSQLTSFTGQLAGSTSNSALSSSSSSSLVSSTTNTKTTKKDIRIRLSAQPSAIAQVYGPNDKSNLLAPLYTTSGLIFPYSPSITMQQEVSYNAVSMIHTNMDWEAYQRTPSFSVSINGKFTIQNQAEGQYALAAVHFLRTVSKMYFGASAGANAGLPPPVLLLNGNGDYIFNNLPVILKSHSWNYDETMDTIKVSVNNGFARLPVMFSLSVSLTVQQTPKVMRTKFNLDTFRTGALMKSGGFI